MKNIDWDEYNRKIYNKNYSADNMKHFFRYKYDQEMANIRFEILKKYCKYKIVADFGCGTGEYFIPIAKIAKKAVGVDFSENMLNILKLNLKKYTVQNIKILRENIKHTSLDSNYFDTVYSLSTLYQIPEVEKIIFEMNRILKQGGIAIFELGNFFSLNTLTTLKASTGAKSFYISVHKMKKIIKQAKFKILTHRSFQILPMHGEPLYLFPFTTPKWKILAVKKIKNKMIDEIISSFFPLNYISFRHMFICKKIS